MFDPLDLDVNLIYTDLIDNNSNEEQAMGVINTRKSGQYVSVQPVRTPSGSVVPAATIAPQQTLVGGDTNVQFEGSPIETTNMTHATTITTPAFPGVISGTVNGIGQTTTGYSKKLMIGNSPAVTNTAKKLTNSGNAPMVPMAQSTSAQTYFFVNDGGGSGVKAGPSTPGALEKLLADNPPWTDEQKDAFSKKLQSCAVDDDPNPAPASILGTCQYYQWRNDDFKKRHQYCDHRNPPDYYLQYGLVFCQLFSTELAAKMDADGKGWIKRTRLNLQKAMEEFVVGNTTIELDSHAFYEAAFNSHNQAYLDAGFLDLSEHDVVQFLDVQKFVETLVIPSDVRDMAFRQTAYLGKLYFNAHNNDKFGKAVGSAKEMVTEGFYLTDSLAHSYIDWLHTHKIYYLDPFNENLE